MSNAPAAPPAPGGVLTVSQDPGLVTVIERFDVPGDRRDDAVDRAKAHIVTKWKADAAFVGAALLRGRLVRGGEAIANAPAGLACYAQWRREGNAPGGDPAAGDTPNAPAPARSLAAALPGFRLVDSRTYSVEFSGHAPSVAPPTLLSVERTPGAHFGIFAVGPGKQNRVVDRARGHAPDSLGTPGLLTINFHRSLDGAQVINLGTWASFDGFQALLGTPGFQTEDVYWQGVADFQPAFFEVVAVEARS